MSRANPKADVFLREAEKWRDEMTLLRKLALHFDLTEELKWGKPCYMFKEANVIIIQPFKEYCALMFCKGVLLKDAKGLLKTPGEHTQAARQLRFTSVQEISKMEHTVKAYISEAIEMERAGLEVKYKTTPEPIPRGAPEEIGRILPLEEGLRGPHAGTARSLHPLHFRGQTIQTRESRIDKCTQRILSGRGLME